MRTVRTLVKTVMVVTARLAACADDPDELSPTGPALAPSAQSKPDAASPPTATGSTTPPPPPSRDAGVRDSGPTPPTPPVGNGAQEICVNEINKWRATEGLPPLQRWTQSETCTDGQCKIDSETNRPHGAIGRCTENAQNECPGWNGRPETMIQGCMKMMWDEKFSNSEKGLYENMKSARFTKVPCGFYVTPSGKLWAIQNFR